MLSQTNFYKNHQGEIVLGLVLGLVSGLVVMIINFPEAFPALASFYPILLLIIGIIILSEIMFWLSPKEKLSKGASIFWHTAKRKLENIFEVLLGLSAIGQVYVLAREIKINIPFEIILKWVGYIGAGIIGIGLVVLVFYIWIKLNSWKYKK
jgi:hypothetical protein